MSDSCLLPEFDPAECAEIAHRLFALEGPLKLLYGERDLNYLITTGSGKFVFKIANADEARGMLDCQHRVFERLEQNQVFPLIARARKSVDGREIETVQDAQGREHFCRVLPFLEGRMWSEFEISSPELLAGPRREIWPPSTTHCKVSVTRESSVPCCGTWKPRR